MTESPLLDIDYRVDGDSTTVRIASRSNGKPHIFTDNSFLPYFYLLPSEQISKAIRQLEELRVEGKGFTKVETVTRLFKGKETELVKLTLQKPPQVPVFREKAREFGTVFEADIQFVRRYAIDNGLVPLRYFVFDTKPNMTKKDYTPKVLAVDIEVYSKIGLPSGGNDPIIAISLYTPGFEKVLTYRQKSHGFVESLADEKAMLKRFVELLHELDPDVLTGYNIDNFDLPYLRDRVHKLGLQLPMGFDKREFTLVKRGRNQAPQSFGLLIVDLYPYVANVVARSLHVESMDLDTIAREIVGEGKLPMPFEEMMELWEKGETKKIFDYSLQDSKVTYKLAEKLLPAIFELSKLSSLSPFDVSRMTSGLIVEWFLMKHAYSENILVPNQPTDIESAERRRTTYEGAYVKEPVKGIHTNIAVCDFRSLYPSIIVSHNVDPSTINCDCCGDGAAAPWFCKKKVGFFPKVLKTVLDERFSMKERMKLLSKNSQEYSVLEARQSSLKLIANSFYGYLGYGSARWYSLECAREITALGRMYINRTITAAEAAGFTALYGDTDSLFISADLPLSEFTEKVSSFTKSINKTLPGVMELELQGIYKHGVLLTKKRYALATTDDKIIVKGLERIRRDWAPIAKQTQEDVLRAILIDNDAKKAEKIVADVVKRLRNRQVAKEDIVILTQLTKSPESYEITAPHVEAAKLMRTAGETIKAGMIIRFVVKPGKGTISSRTIPAERATVNDYDPEYYINNQVLPAVTRILEAVGIDSSLVKEQSKLSSFFG